MKLIIRRSTDIDRTTTARRRRLVKSVRSERDYDITRRLHRNIITRDLGASARGVDAQNRSRVLSISRRYRAISDNNNVIILIAPAVSLSGPVNNNTILFVVITGGQPNGRNPFWPKQKRTSFPSRPKPTVCPFTSSLLGH